MTVYRTTYAPSEISDELRASLDLFVGLLAASEKGTHYWRLIEHRIRMIRALLAKIEGTT
jgi:hypothetical protein